MKSPLHILAASLLLALGIQGCSGEEAQPHPEHPEQHEPGTTLVSEILAASPSDTLHIEKITLTEEEWRERLTSSEYRILRDRGTELPFVNEYWDNKEEGIYYCRGCGLPLYRSDTKYRSGSGWPSFWEPIDLRLVEEREDNSFFMTRTEIVCARCGSHLGHVFEDGPEPTGLRYCMNSAALEFREEPLPEN